MRNGRARLVVSDVSSGLDKFVASPSEALSDVASGSTLAVGGFGLCGVPTTLIRSILLLDVDDLRVVSNNCGTDDMGLGILLAQRRISRMTSSYVGENHEFARQYLAGELEVELVPQGTLAERLRAGGCGIAAFYTATGVGTAVSEGGIPIRYDGGDGVEVASSPKETRILDALGEPREYVLETGIVCDFALVRAWKGDRYGNLVYRYSARNFNPLCAMAGRITVAEVEELVEPGQLHPDEIDTPSIFVQRVVVADISEPKHIERVVNRSSEAAV